MALSVDNRQQSQLSGLGYDHLRYPQPPQFTNPWVSAPSTQNPSQVYSSSVAPHSESTRSTTMSIPFPGVPVSGPSLGASMNPSSGLYEAQNSLATSQDLLNPSRPAYGSSYTSTSPSSSTFAPTSAPHYAVDYDNTRTSSYNYGQNTSRRSSHPSVTSATFLGPLDTLKQRQNSLVDLNRLQTQSQRNSFSEAIDAGRGMVAMSQDITPRNIYGNMNPRNSTDSYGFPSTHSAHSSISSASTYPSYYNGSVGEGSVTDYSSASESVDAMNSRTLPRPNALVGTNLPPAPQSMMGQFSSKVSSSSQKKHKCKICDKRFTRPSSLQTHMYSHTGEKPFACEVEGCGRHFSVVSNLRRHRKVHKGERDPPSPDDM